MRLKPISVKAGTWFEAHDFADDYPLAEGPDLWAMAKHMKETVGFLGQFPIVLKKDAGKLKVLDGRRRQMACKREGITPKFVEFAGTDLEALAFVDAANLHRRHLGQGDRDSISKKSLGRRALLAGAAATAKPGNRANLHGSQEKTLGEAAAEQGVSRRTAADGKAVVESGTEALQAAVIDGTVSVSDAAKVAAEPPPVQDAAVEAVRNGQATTAAEAVEREPGDEAEEPDVTDAEGVKVPARAIAAFVAADEMEKWCRQVDGLVRQLKEFGAKDGGRCVNVESVKLQLQSAKGSVWGNRPTHVCPYCKGKDKPCEPCKGEGWVPKHVWIAAPGNSDKAKRA